MTLFLQRIVGRTHALHKNAVRLNLKRLLCVGSELQSALNAERRADIQLAKACKIVELFVLYYYLNIFEKRAVVKLDKAEIL